MVDEPQPWKEKTVTDANGNKERWVWSHRHKSIYYGGLGHRFMFPGIELSYWVTCALHLRQRTTALEVKVGICQWLDRDWKKSKKKKRARDGAVPEDGPQTDVLSAMFECLLSKGKKIPKLDGAQTILKRQMSGRLLGLATRNWDGGTCKLIEAFGPLLLEAAHPASQCTDPLSEAAINKQVSTHPSIHPLIHPPIYASIHPFIH